MNNNIKVISNSWIGLSTVKSDSSYEWSNQEKLEFSHWDRTFPNVTVGKCVVMKPSGFWVNAPCDTKFIRLVYNDF